MSAIYFQLNADQEVALKRLMKKSGYTKKSEFFRFLLNHYNMQLEERFERVTKNLGKALIELDRQGMIPSLDEQLKDI